MAIKLPPVGVAATVQNSKAFISQMNAINQAVANSAKQMQSSAAQTQGFGGAFSKIAGIISSAGSTILNVIMGIVTAVGVTLVAALALAGGAFVGFIALANRGAPLVGLRDSFDKLTTSIGITSDALLTNLRNASMGTVSDFKLIETANTALAGATGEYGKLFGEALPKLLTIARVQSRATGQAVDFLFQSLVSGVKRASPMLIDNTGIVLRVSAANEAYAQSLGKTVDELTPAEQKIALLNATLEAGDVAIAKLGASFMTNADRVAAIGASIANIFDNLAVDVQPAFTTILQIVQSLLSGIEGFVNQATPYLTALAQIVSDALYPILDTVGGIAEQLNSPGAAKAFFTGAANTFGSFLAGVEQMATQILAVVTNLAQGIANLLLGESPPPEGPLHNMTTGAMKTMQAWVDGFIGGFNIDPVKQVAQEVQDALGSIATMNRGQVEKRLAELDAAAKPFSDRLQIIKSSFDAIQQAAQPALDAIDRQIADTMQAVINGDAAAAATVRSLDAQKQALTDMLDTQQAVVDQAQLQYSLVMAQQAQERTLLSIRQAQLGTAVATTKATKKATEKAAAKPKEEKKPTGSGATPTPPATPDVSSTGGVGNIVGDVFKSQAIAGAKQDLIDSFNQGLGTAPLMLNMQNAALNAQVDRLKSITGTNNVVAKGLDSISQSIQTKFDEIKKSLDDWVGSVTDPNREGSVPYAFAHLGDDIGSGLDTLSTNIASALGTAAGQINGKLIEIQLTVTDWIGSITDPNREGSIPYAWAHLGDSITTAITGIKVDFTTWFTQTFQTPLMNLFNGLLASAGQPGSVLYFFSNLPANILGALNIAASAVQTSIINPLKTNILDPIMNAFSVLTGDAATPGSVLYAVTNLPTLIGEALAPVGATITGAFNAAVFFLTGVSTDATTLTGVLNMALVGLSEFPAQIGQALKSIGVQLWNNFAVPIINILNTIIDAFNEMKMNILSGLSKLAESAASAFSFLPDIHNLLHDASVLLQNEAKLNQIAHLSTAPPGFLTGGATGGLFSSGIMKVGERGTELITSATKKAVFPADFTRAMTSVMHLLQPRSVAYATPSVVNQSSSSTTDRSMTNIFNGVDGAQDTVRRLAMMKAFL